MILVSNHSHSSDIGTGLDFHWNLSRRGSGKLHCGKALPKVASNPLNLAGETGETPAPKEQPPRKLSGKRTAREGYSGK